MGSPMDGWRLDRVGEAIDDTDRRFETMPIYGADDDPADQEPAHLRLRRAQQEDEAEAEGAAKRLRTGLLPVLFGTLAIVLILGGGVILWQVYRSMSAPQPLEVPLLRADPGPIRIAPSDPGGLDVPHRNRLVLEDPEAAATVTAVEEEVAVTEEPMTDVIAAMREGLGGPELPPADAAPGDAGPTTDPVTPEEEALAEDLRAAVEALILRGGPDLPADDAEMAGLSPGDAGDAVADPAAPDDSAGRPDRLLGANWADQPEFHGRNSAAGLTQPPSRVVAAPLVGRTEEARPVGHAGDGAPAALALLGAGLPVTPLAPAPEDEGVEESVAAPPAPVAAAPLDDQPPAATPAPEAAPAAPEDAAPTAVSPPQVPTPPRAPPAPPAQVAAVPEQPAPAATPPAPVAAGPATHGVQVVAVASELEAATEWVRFQDSFPDLLGERRLEVRRVDLGDRGVWFRVLAASPNRRDADTLCAALRARGSDCIVRDL